MKHTRKLLALLLVMCLTPGILSISALAADTDTAVPGVTVSEEADANGLYDVTFTLDTAALTLDKAVNEVYLYGSFARYPTNVSQWQDTHRNEDESAKMEDWWLTELEADKTISGVIIPEEYADGTYLSGTAPLEQPTYAQRMEQIDDSGVYSVTLKLPASPYYYRYAVNPVFTLAETDMVGTGNAILSDKKAYTISADYLSYDPHNPSISNMEGGHIQGKSMVVVGDGGYYTFDANAAKGTVSFVPYTDVNQNTRYLGVYLPAGYSESGAAYKTLYMSHGMGGEETEWMNKGRVQDVFDAAIASGALEPTVVITMDNTADYNWDYNTIRDNLLEHIIPFVENSYHVSEAVEDRAMLGLSMGGRTTAWLYMNASESFGYFAALSGATPEDPEHYPLSAVSERAKLYVAAGEEDFGWSTDGEIGGFCGVKQWMAQLDAAGISYTEQHVPGTHDWYTWSQILIDVIDDFLWKTADDAWYTEAIEYVRDNGLLEGIGDAAFQPDESITRAEIVKLLFNLEGQPAVSETASFTDTAPGQWYENAVAWSAQNGIIYGYGDGSFGPDDAITREQFMAVIYRYAQYKGYDVSKTSSLSEYADANQISSFALAAMQWAHAEELLTGTADATLSPAGTATHAEAAMIFMNFCKLVHP